MGDDPRPPALPGETPDAYVRRVTAPLGAPVLPAGRATSDELKLLGPTGKAAVQGARTLVRVLTIVVPALVAAAAALVSAYQHLADEARLRAEQVAHRGQVETQRVKNESEAGYQILMPVSENHTKRLAEIERQLAAQQHPAARRGRTRLPPVPPPKPLPSDLEKAERQISRATAPSPSPLPTAPDAGVTGR